MKDMADAMGAGWQLVDPRAHLGTLASCRMVLLLVDGSGRQIVSLLEVTQHSATKKGSDPALVTVTHGMPGARQSMKVDVPRAMSLEQFATTQTGTTLQRAMLVPRISWARQQRTTVRWIGLVIAIMVMAPALPAVFSTLWDSSSLSIFNSSLFTLFLLGLLLGVFIAFGMGYFLRNIVLGSDPFKRMPIDADMLRWRLDSIQAQPPQSIPPVGVTTPRVGTESRRQVAVLKETYGSLFSDVVYRIENSALFDSAVPLTKEFELLLMRWDDEQAYLDEVAAARLADELELAFATARRNAETLGMRHLPETAQPDAAKAANAARIAQQASTQGSGRPPWRLSSGCWNRLPCTTCRHRRRPHRCWPGRGRASNATDGSRTTGRVTGLRCNLTGPALKGASSRALLRDLVQRD